MSASALLPKACAKLQSWCNAAKLGQTECAIRFKSSANPKFSNGFCAPTIERFAPAPSKAKIAS